MCRLTEIVLCHGALFFCSKTALTIPYLDGWRNRAISVLRTLILGTFESNHQIKIKTYQGGCWFINVPGRVESDAYCGLQKLAGTRWVVEERTYILSRSLAESNDELKFKMVCIAWRIINQPSETNKNTHNVLGNRVIHNKAMVLAFYSRFQVIKTRPSGVNQGQMSNSTCWLYEKLANQ